mmetsp:Transcript_5114/g.12790  ORF Transcript_5114/g.12790 Transcript_5114/m.12790 type:complete len:236 (-) Transcript_5114:319-1026(-)
MNTRQRQVSAALTGGEGIYLNAWQHIRMFSAPRGGRCAAQLELQRPQPAHQRLVRRTEERVHAVKMIRTRTATNIIVVAARASAPPLCAHAEKRERRSERDEFPVRVEQRCQRRGVRFVCARALDAAQRQAGQRVRDRRRTGHVRGKHPLRHLKAGCERSSGYGLVTERPRRLRNPGAAARADCGQQSGQPVAGLGLLSARDGDTAQPESPGQAHGATGQRGLLRTRGAGAVDGG